MLSLLLVLPIVGLVALLILARAFWRYNVTRWIVAGCAAGATAAVSLAVYGIFHSTSSTAGIGILFVPFAAAFGGAAGALVGFAAYQSRHIRTRSRQGLLPGIVSIASLALLLFLVGYSIQAARRIHAFYTYRQDTNPESLASGASQFLRSGDYFVLSAIAANDKLPADALLQIARDPDKGLHQKRSEWINIFDRDQLAVERKVVRNPNAPTEALVILAASPNDYVLADVCAEKRTPESVLRERCATKDNYLVHWSLAGNAQAPSDVLAALPRAKDKYVAHGLSYNPRTPVDILNELASHEDPLVRQGVAQNPSASPATLALLTRDRVEYVSRLAQRRLRDRPAGTQQANP